MRVQFNLQRAFAVIAWLSAAVGIYCLIPLPRTSVPGYWFGATAFVCWIGLGLGRVFGRSVLGGLLGAMLGLFIAVLSVQ